MPLENAHRSGGATWSKEKKGAYANDLDESEHLVAVAKSANRAKGLKGPGEWLPKNESFLCTYVSQWQAIKKRWVLRMAADERQTVEQILGSCGK